MRIKIGIIGFSKTLENFVSHIFENIDYIKFKHQFSIHITFYYNGINHMINEKGLKPDEVLEAIRGSLTTEEDDITFVREINNLPSRIKESKARIVIVSLPQLLKKQNYKLLKKLLENKIDIITTNKNEVVENIDELEDIAEYNNLFFSYIPALNLITPIGDLLENISSSFEIHGFEGIFNRFTNIIISEMIKNKSSVKEEVEFLKEIFPEHKELISEDLNGYDSACTAFLLARKYMTGNIKFEDIKIMGIENLNYEKIKKVVESGNSVKLLGKASYEDEILKIRVTPSIISKEHNFYNINDMSEAINIFSDFPTNTFFVAKGSDNIERDVALSIYRELIKYSIYTLKKFEH